MEEVKNSVGQTPAVDKAPAVKSAKKKKGKIKVSKGRLYINATFNNTIISATDQNGNIISWSTAGRSGFKGSKKSTPFAGQRTMEDLIFRLKDSGLVEAEVFVNGLGNGRESAVRALHSAGVKISSIKDTTPVPHGGVRKKKARRL